MKFAKVDKGKLKQLVKKGGLSSASLKKKKSCLKTFNAFLADNGYPSVDEYIMDLKNDPSDVAQLQEHLQEFFYGMEKDNGEKHKKQTILSYRTQIKMHIWRETDKQVDIMDPIRFADFVVSKVKNFLNVL